MLLRRRPTARTVSGVGGLRQAGDRVAIILGMVFFLTASAWAGLPATIEQIKPSIVGVGTFQPTRRPQAKLLGTGFVVGDGHHVLTNAHVLVEPPDKEHREFLAVFVGQGRSAEPRRARRVAVDREHDLLVLEFDGRPLPALTLSDSDRVREGERYAFTGFPIGAVLGLYPATHQGVVAAITPIVRPQDQARQLDARSIKRLRDPYDVFQLDATAYPGNSGSPLYDPDNGDVVGVVNMVFVKGTKEKVLSDPSGITYAIPSNYARRLLKKAKVLK